MRPAATSDVLDVRAVKLAVPRGAEVTIKISPMSTVPPIVIVLIWFTGMTDVTEFVLVILIGAVVAVPLKPITLAVVSVNDVAVVKIAVVPVHETTSVPWFDEPTFVSVRILPAILDAFRALLPAPVSLSIVAALSEQSSSSNVEPAVAVNVIVHVPIVNVLLFPGNDCTSIVRVAFTSATFATGSARVAISELDPTDAFATVCVAVKVGPTAAKAGLTKEKTMVVIAVIAVTFLNLSTKAVNIKIK